MLFQVVLRVFFDVLAFDSRKMVIHKHYKQYQSIEQVFKKARKKTEKTRLVMEWKETTFRKKQCFLNF